MPDVKRMESFLYRIFGHMQSNDIDSVRKDFPEELEIALEKGYVFKSELKMPKGIPNPTTLILVKLTPLGKRILLKQELVA